MPIERVTLSVPREVAARLKRAAGTKPVSAWVTALIEAHLDQAELETQFREFCEEHVATKAERTKAETILARLRKPTQIKRSA